MNKFLFSLISLFFLTGFYPESFSQQQRTGQGAMAPSDFTGTVKGKVIDSQDGLPVEYANIVLFRQRDSSLVTGGITNINGEFEIQKVPMGKYYGEVKFIGYNTTRIEVFGVGPRQPEVIFASLSLDPASENIDAVTVTGDKRMLTHNLDKKVFTVDKDINAEGGSALDVMHNIPAVDVDMEGNVSLRGSQNVTILIDGRPSTYSSIDEIPASIIESVEVITNPSARYDPDGLSGIINIVLKKKREPGYHGMVMLNAGTGDKYNGSLNFNYRQNKFNFFTNMSYRQFRMTGTTISDRTSIMADNTSFLFQDQDFRRKGKFISFKGGADYFINTSSTLTLTGGYNTRSFAIWDLTQTDTYLPVEVLTESYLRNSDGDNDFSSYEFALNYKKTGKQQGQELTTDAFFNSNNGSSGSDLNQWWPTSSANSLFEQTNSDVFGNTLTLQTDLVQPIGNGGRLETGVKGLIRSQDNDYNFSFLNTEGTMQDDPLKSNRFIYDEQLYSAYAIYSNTFGKGKFSYQAGLRAEQSFTKANQKVNTTPINREFLNFFPSAHIKWDINEKNSTQIAYSRRVNRPHTRLLNPFIDYSDPLNLSTGNPYLNPEFTNSIELSYYYNLPKTKLSGTTFYRKTTDIISRYVELDDNGVAWSTYRNINKSESLGFEGVITQTLTKWWRVNGSASYFSMKLDAPDLSAEASKGNSWTAKATSTWSVGQNFEVQLNGNYRSPVISAGGTGHFWGSGGGQGKTAEMYWLDLGVRLNVLNRKGTITLRVSDILNTMVFRSETIGTNFTSNLERTRESRVVFLGFSYKINEYRVRREKKSEENGNDMDFE